VNFKYFFLFCNSTNHNQENKFWEFYCSISENILSRFIIACL